ncbi:MAG: tetratricopeptide repeat protein [Sphingobacteriales bacterium]|nr:MAG: tetratricopeptide repeat protein [Sphingobacteriales bacterium]
MKRVTEILLLVLFLLCSSAFAQSKQGAARLDSLLAAVPSLKEDTAGAKLMGKIGAMYPDRNPDSGLFWAQKELALSKRLDFVTGMLDAYTIMGNNYTTQGALPKALSAFLEGLRLAEDRGSIRSQSVLLSNIGGCYMQMAEYKKAQPCLLRALQLMEQSGDLYDVEYLLQSLGGTHAALKDYTKSILYYSRALRIVEASGSSEGISNVAGNLGLLYDELGQYNQALVYKYRALDHAERIGDKQLTGTNHGSIGETYLALATNSVRPITTDSRVLQGQTANLDRAVYHLNRGIQVSREAGYPENLPAFYTDLSDAYTAQGNYPKALEAYRSSVSIADSLKEMEGKREIHSLETQRALELKDKDIRIAELEVVQKRNERTLLIAGIGLLLVILSILIYNFRRHERSRRRIRALQDYKISQLDEAVKRRTEQLDSMRQTIATDFHDQTGNMLAAIARQAATLEIKLLHQPEFLPAIRSIMENSNELYASSKDFLWNLNHDSDDPLVLLQYLSGYGQRFYNQFDMSFSAIVSGEPQLHLQLHPLAGLSLIYIFKEAMSNVVKHSGADEVALEMHWETAHVVYSLHDNGMWKEADPSVEHYGLRNMERRCRQSGFSYVLHHDQSGTRIRIGLALNAYRIQSLTS